MPMHALYKGEPANVVLLYKISYLISNQKMVATDTLVNDFSPETGFLLLFEGLMLKF